MFFLQKFKQLVFLLIFLLSSKNVFAQYEISGYIKNYDSIWTNKLYLAIIEPDSYYGEISDNQIINTGLLDSSGYFSLKGGGLPDKYFICRLSLTEEGISSQLIRFEPKNYILFVLGNDSKIILKAENIINKPLDYTFSGDNAEENNKIRELEKLLEQLQTDAQNPYMQKGKGKELFKEKYYNSIHSFCDPENYPLASIIALQHVNLEEDYSQNKDFYLDFIEHYNHKKGKNTAYLTKLKERLQIIEYKNKKNSASDNKKIIYILSVLLLISALYIISLKFKLRKIKPQISEKEKKHL